MNITEIEKIFEKLRKAGHGSLIKFDAGGGQPVEAIIFEPVPRRPSGFESGVFVTVPSDRSSVYYFDPEASKEQGRIVIQKIDMKKAKTEPETPANDILAEFAHLQEAAGIRRGGGAVGEAHSKYVGVIEIGK